MMFSLAQVLFITVTSWAGDVATFKNLGFSFDSRYFQFALYGIDDSCQSPYVEVCTVDVHKNEFVTNGYSKALFPVRATLGDGGLNALLAHLEKLTPQRKSLRIDYLQQGRPIYFRVVSEESSQKTNNFQVLDYTTGREYGVHLKENVRSTGSLIRSSFGIDLTIKDTHGSLVGSYQVGHPFLERDNIQKYTIVQMILAPNDKALVFVIEREESDGRGGVNIRAMVETVVF